MPCPRPIKPSCFSYDLTRAHQAQGAIRLYRDKKLITLAEV